MSFMRNKAIVIGSGIAGIATSIRLAQKGYEVQVFESNSYPGGKLSAFSLGDFRFDAGPSLFTMPNFVDELFDLCNEDSKDYFQYSKKEIGCNYFWEDGTRLKAYDNQDKFLEEVKNVLGVSPETLKKYWEKAKKKYDLTESIFLKSSLHKMKSFLNLDTLRAILNIKALEIGKTLHEVNKAQLQEPHLIQFYDRFATYNGSDPYQTPGIMTLVQHLEGHYGTFIPKKGMESITSSLFELAKRQGVTFNFNEKVEETKSEIVEKVDAYLNYVVEEWMKENELAIEKGLRAEITEDFIGGLKSLFESHYINVPQEKYDVIEAQTAEIEKLKEEVNSTIEKNVELNQAIGQHVRTDIINDVTSDLAETETEKLKGLAEGIEYKGVISPELTGSSFSFNFSYSGWTN